MKWAIPCKALWSAKLFDILDVLKKGREEYVPGSNAQGTLEDWMMYFYADSKPFSIEQCLEAYNADDLSRFFVRNRWDAAATNDLYKLIMLSQQQAGSYAVTGGAAAGGGQGTAFEGMALAQCPICLSNKNMEFKNGNAKCPVCKSAVSTADIIEG